MRRIWVMTTLLPLLAIAAKAQEAPITPKAEVFGTYSFFRLGSDDNFRARNLNKGFAASGVYNVNEWLGLMGDIGGHWGGFPLTIADQTVNVKVSMHTLVGGPRFTYRRYKKVTPYANILVGGAQLYRGYRPPPSPAPAPAPTAPAPTSPAPSPAAPTPTAPAPAAPSPTAPSPAAPVSGGANVPYIVTPQGTIEYNKKTDLVFAWAVGGGLDVKLSDRIEYRPFEAEYMMTRADGLSGRGVNNLRLSTGIGFSFGSK